MALLVPLILVLLAAGCSRQPSTPQAPQLRDLGERPVVVSGADAAALAVATSAALYRSAPVVVLAADDDLAGQARSASLAVALGVPALVAPAAGQDGPVRDELGRLGAAVVLAVGTAAAWARAQDGGPAVVEAPADPAALERLTGRRFGAPEPIDSARLVADVAALGRNPTALLAADPPVPDRTDRGSDQVLPTVTPAVREASVLVLAQATPDQALAVATARASGAQVRVLAVPDPRAAAGLATVLNEHPAGRVVALGAAFGTPEVLRGRLEAAATGAELPGGGQVLFPGRHMVALYGHPGAPALGVLGEQPVDAAVRRAQRLARSYQSLVADPVVPAFEIIATVADSAPGPDGDYSAESSVTDLRPWVDAARAAGMYVVLDLQPGRADFLSQARRYTELLTEPHVGLALDPEWRLGPGQLHRVQIGSVTAAEINTVVEWLADLTRDHHLPQKLLMLHQFQLGMISDRGQVDTGRDELAVLIHADGFGTPELKFGTWNALHADPPPNLWWGWKNFYDEDTPTFTPAQTVAVGPISPVFISYQ
ncbi:hypothetical protein [Pseudonocardia asaccharolytica]|uniref:Lipoprotein n=1 Tax=Pseudonocardia asaccharolytica DSM 44247 = NBRC 16224 TaxID=1123024 RepID=A0A511D026_9PSEU|nr:hypothetical protein [Pseudonocardia asaccharolytica]GEL18057.1 hypothetical protein PA7_18940 [Pseudonocardia asaccharolytica DSM 44247 = NBRC 16224]